MASLCKYCPSLLVHTTISNSPSLNLKVLIRKRRMSLPLQANTSPTCLYRQTHAIVIIPKADVPLSARWWLLLWAFLTGEITAKYRTHIIENFCARDWRWSIIPWGYLYFGKRRLVVCQGLAISGAWRPGCNQKDNIPWDNISRSMDMNMDYGHGQYVIRMYVFSLRLIISSGLQESIYCLDFKVYVTRGF